jgi:hypothetical protein
MSQNMHPIQRGELSMGQGHRWVKKYAAQMEKFRIDRSPQALSKQLPCDLFRRLRRFNVL